MNCCVAFVADLVVERNCSGFNLSCCFGAGDVEQPADDGIQAKTLHGKAFFFYLPLRARNLIKGERTRSDGNSSDLVNGQKMLFYTRQTENSGGGAY